MSYGDIQVDQKTFNKALKLQYNQTHGDDIAEKKYLHTCFYGKNGYYAFLQNKYYRPYSFIFDLSKHISNLENSPTKKNVGRADLLKKLVKKLFDTDSSRVASKINKFHRKHARDLGRYPIFPSKTSKFLTEVARTGMNEAESFSDAASKKMGGSSDKVYYIDSRVNQCVAGSYVKDFNNLIKDRIAEETQKIAAERSFFTKVGHFFNRSAKQKYFKEKLAPLNFRLESYKNISSTREMLVRVKSEVQTNRDLFGQTTIGQKLSDLWGNFKLAYKKAGASLKINEKNKRIAENKSKRLEAEAQKNREEAERKKQLEQKNREEAARKKQLEQKKREEAKQKRKLTKKKKRKEAKQRQTNISKFFKKPNKPRKLETNHRNDFHPEQIKSICFRNKPKSGVGVIEISYNKMDYYMKRYLSSTEYKKLKDGNEFSQLIAGCYKSLGGFTRGIEFDKTKFDKIFSSSENKPSYSIN